MLLVPFCENKIHVILLSIYLMGVCVCGGGGGGGGKTYGKLFYCIHSMETHIVNCYILQGSIHGLVSILNWEDLIIQKQVC